MARYWHNKPVPDVRTHAYYCGGILTEASENNFSRVGNDRNQIIVTNVFLHVVLRLGSMNYIPPPQSFVTDIREFMQFFFAHFVSSIHPRFVPESMIFCLVNKWRTVPARVKVVPLKTKEWVMTEGKGRKGGAFHRQWFGSIVPTDRFNMSISVVTVGFQVDRGHVMAEGVMYNIAWASHAV